MKKAAALAAIAAALIFCTKAQAADLSELPEEVVQICDEAGEEFQVCPMILASLVYTETRGIIPDNLTQITNTKWFEEGMDACEVDEIKTPENNIRVCAYYIAKWAEEYDDIFLALDSWRYGPENAVRKYKDKPSYYSKEIATRSAEWEPGFYESKRKEANPCKK